MRFLIVAAPRTGSSHLCDLLNGQPDILCNGEVFHPRKAYVRWPRVPGRKQTIQELEQLRERDAVEFVEHIFATDFGRSHVGFKMFDGHHDSILEQLIDSRDVRKIVLYRRNVLANYSSKLLASASGKWDHRNNEPVQEQRKVRFNAKQFVKFHNKYVEYYGRVLARLNESQQCFWLHNYEDINSNHLFAGLVGFIGGKASSISLESKHRRQNSADIVSRFVNPDAVERFMSACRLQHWAHEGDTSLKQLSIDILMEQR